MYETDIKGDKLVHHRERKNWITIRIRKGEQKSGKIKWCDYIEIRAWSAVQYCKD